MFATLSFTTDSSGNNNKQLTKTEIEFFAEKIDPDVVKNIKKTDV